MAQSFRTADGSARTPAFPGDPRDLHGREQANCRGQSWCSASALADGVHWDNRTIWFWAPKGRC